jgi:hypothetical protein
MLGCLGVLAAGLTVSGVRAQDAAPSAPPESTAQTDDGGQAPAPGQDPSQNQAPADGQDSSASFQTFYDSLSQQGTWIQSADYGYVWQPQVSDPNWAPYTQGYWAYTDDGWTWVSDESFGWATYHYGRWVNLDGTGWVWVPGYTWGPAWVSWRYGDGYAGWAPLPPDSFAGIDYFGDGYDASFGFHIGGDCDGFYGIGPALYIFLPVNCLCYHDYRHWYRDRHDNYGLINRTTNVTNINVTRNQNREGTGFAGGRLRHVTTGGPQLAQVNAASTTPIQRVNLVRANQPGGGTLAQGSLALYAPHVRPAEGALQPARVMGTIGKVKINRGTDVLQPPAVNARLAPAPATQAQIEAAKLAQDHAPAGAKVMTDASSVKPIFQGPVSSWKPAATVLAPRPASTPGVIYGNAGAQPVYGGPVHTPANAGSAPSVSAAPSREFVPPSRIYSPAPTATPPRYTPTEAGGVPAEPRTYVPRSAPSSAPSTAPAYHSSPAPAASGGGAPSGGRSSAGSGGSSGGSSAGSASGSGGGNGRSH